MPLSAGEGDIPGMGEPVGADGAMVIPGIGAIVDAGAGDGLGTTLLRGVGVLIGMSGIGAIVGAAAIAGVAPATISAATRERR